MMSIMTDIKQSIRQILVNRRIEKYEAELTRKNISYDTWIRRKEAELGIPGAAGHKAAAGGDRNGISEGRYRITEVTFEQLAEEFHRLDKILNQDIIIVHPGEGRLSRLAGPLIERYFSRNPSALLVYGDEDRMDGQGNRTQPWFKPDWSPDTFLASFYIGGIFAARGQALRETLAELRESRGEGEPGKDVLRLVYTVCRLLAEKSGGFRRRDGENFPVGHISEVLFHRAASDTGGLCRELEIGQRAAERQAPARKTQEREAQEAGMVSVIIPSKDHPELLENCIASVLRTTGAAKRPFRFEVIVVDNGSTEENRKRIGDMLAAVPCARYLYRPMPFHFSRMCNLGAAEAEGELLLFLNDDIEAVEAEWMERLAHSAKQPYAGAVGAKLLYPDSRKIQHAGITNIRLGPMHKLQFMEDGESHYFGVNRKARNMLGVTGACLMVRRRVFEQAGGFAEELPVAFNDVDLCFTLFEYGYYNVVRNDTALCHRESVSRGNDSEDEDKIRRLMQERDILYQRHPGLYGRDPFYHKYLTQDCMDFRYAATLEYDPVERMAFARTKARTKPLPEDWADACLRVDVEYAERLGERLYGPLYRDRDLNYYIQGYAFVIGSDNARYVRKLLLWPIAPGKEGSRMPGELLPAGLPVVEAGVISVYRPDVEENLQDQMHVGLTGFAAKLREEDVARGQTYRIGMLAIDRCSSKRIVNWSSRYLDT